MRFIKRILGKIRHLAKKLICQPGIYPIFLASRDPTFLIAIKEGFPLYFQFFFVFLGHMPTDIVALPQGIASKFLEDLHDLFLVYDKSICGA